MSPETNSRVLISIERKLLAAKQREEAWDNNNWG